MCVYEGHSVGDLDSLRARSFALAEYLSTSDELNEMSEPQEDQDTSTGGRRRRRSAVTGMDVLALE
jgi:hypothetical protein